MTLIQPSWSHFVQLRIAFREPCGVQRGDVGDGTARLPGPVAPHGTGVAVHWRMNTSVVLPQPTDRQLQVDVLNALDHAPLSRTSFGVTVSHGVVTLLGCVHSRREAWLAEQVVYDTPGVLGIANSLHVEEHPDEDASAIAEAAVDALTRYRVVASGSVKVITSNGYVTLTGVVANLQQRGAAERAVRHIRGVRGVWDALKVRHPEGSVPAAPGRDLYMN